MIKKNFLDVCQTDASWVYVSWDFIQEGFDQFFLSLSKRDQDESWLKAYDVSISIHDQSWHLLIPDPGHCFRVSLSGVSDNGDNENVLAESEPFETIPSPKTPEVFNEKMLHMLSTSDDDCTSW
ncbi:hypothetical protein AB834_01200 [PVC group bacterium (ex Bugula neritina AB1)]|nr:hypothetical protein AB834_01200 [PVC group bacterium (ex Bugula neritina AB1)]